MTAAEAAAVEITDEPTDQLAAEQLAELVRACAPAFDPRIAIRNLAIAMALCSADHLGFVRCWHDSNDGTAQWEPGCGRPAP